MRIGRDYPYFVPVILTFSRKYQMSREARLQFIEENIKKNKKVALKEISDYFQVNEKTIRRDIEYLRDSCGAPIRYSREAEGYIYDYDFALYTNEKEKRLLFYSLIRNLGQNLNYLPVQSETFLNHLEQSLDRSYLEIADSIRYELSDTEPVNLDFFAVILQSIRTKKQLSIAYTGRNGKKSTRDIEVLKIVNYGGKWYIFSYCNKSRSLRNFMISRLEQCNLTDKTTAYTYGDETLEDKLSGSFGIFKDGSSQTATIKFAPEIFHLIKHQVWHSAQTSSEEDGSFVLNLPIGERHEEIIGRVLKFGDQAEIISPPELRYEWIAVIKRMWERVK